MSDASMAKANPNVNIEERLARFPSKEADISPGVISLREAGAGPALVLLHGIGSGSGSWLQQLESPGGARLLAWDAPGYGTSTPLPVAAPTAADYADALAALLLVLKIDRLVLVGHSLGALMAAAFAARHPQRLHGLVLLNPAGGYGNADPALREERLTSRLKMMEELGPSGLAEQRAAQLLSPAASTEALELVRWNMRQLDPAGHEQAARMLADGKLVEDAARYPGPTLVMCGSEDRITPEPGCRKIAEAFARGTYRSLPGLGHASYVEAPAVVNAALAEFGREAGAW
jgi:pimeloyl-ACP methyl ester carboxylesterase